MHVGPSVLQRYYALPSLMGRKVVTSCWVVRGLPVAACFREDTDRTTNNNSCFVPHFVEPSDPMPREPGADGCSQCCSHRKFDLSPNQYRLRSEFYGVGGLASADLGALAKGGVAVGGGSLSPSGHAGTSFVSPRHFGSSYGGGGFAGQGYSPTGGGSGGGSGSGVGQG